MNNLPKQYIFVGVGIFLLVLIGGLFFMNSRNSAKQSNTNVTPTAEEDEPIPTVDPSVEVELTPSNSGRELVISVNGVPDGTESIDYELSYDTVAQGLQGVIGTIEVEGEKEAKKEVTLGTCSSGTCVYHEVDGAVNVTLLFSGSYGEQTYENEFELDE